MNNAHININNYIRYAVDWAHDLYNENRPLFKSDQREILENSFKDYNHLLEGRHSYLFQLVMLIVYDYYKNYFSKYNYIINCDMNYS